MPQDKIKPRQPSQFEITEFTVTDLDLEDATDLNVTGFTQIAYQPHASVSYYVRLYRGDRSSNSSEQIGSAFSYIGETLDAADVVDGNGDPYATPSSVVPRTGAASFDLENDVELHLLDQSGRGGDAGEDGQNGGGGSDSTIAGSSELRVRSMIIFGDGSGGGGGGGDDASAPGAGGQGGRGNDVLHGGLFDDILIGDGYDGSTPTAGTGGDGNGGNGGAGGGGGGSALGSGTDGAIPEPYVTYDALQYIAASDSTSNNASTNSSVTTIESGDANSAFPNALVSVLNTFRIDYGNSEQNEGEDILNGQSGNDLLIGGRGRDIFEFDFTPNLQSLDVSNLGDRAGEVDRVLDFNVDDDKVRLLYQFGGDSTATALNPFDTSAFYHDMFTITTVSGGASDSIMAVPNPVALGTFYHQIAFSPTDDVTLYVRLFGVDGDADPLGGAALDESFLVDAAGDDWT